MARILALSNWYPPHHSGGYEILCRDVMVGLEARGHAVEVLCSDTVVPGALSEDSPFPVTRGLSLYWRDGRPWRPGRRAQLAMERANQRALREALDRVRPDVVSVWQMGALSLSLLTTLVERGIPLVFAVSDEWPIYGLALDPWAGRWNANPLTRDAGRAARSVLGTPTVVADLGPAGTACFASDFTRRAVAHGAPWAFTASRVIHSGVNLARFGPGAGPARPWQWRLLYVGRLDPRKGVDTLLRAVAVLPEATLSVAGRAEGAEQARLDKEVARLGLADRVTFEGFVAGDLAEVYRRADCVVFPSEWPEPFGMVPLEAMACGVPVVATGVGGSGEYLVDGDNALLFGAGDGEALAAEVRRLGGDEGLRRRLTEGGTATAAALSLEATVDAFEEAHLAEASGSVQHAPSPRSGALRTRLAHWWRGWRW